MAVILLVALSSVIVNNNISKWTERRVIDWDVTYYYCYLPATFIENDIGLKFVDNNPDYYTLNHMYFPHECPNGNYVIKTTMGMAIMYLPFFTTAHIYAKLFGYETNGFSEPYQCLIQFSGLFYLLIGLWYLRKILLDYFAEKTVALTILCLVFGTNLFFYGSVHGAMAHAVDFMLVSLFVFHSIIWLKQPNYQRAVWLGLTAGMLVLIRPVNVIFIGFIVLYNINSLSDFLARIRTFIQNGKQIMVMIMLALVCVLPQLLYWKYITGHYFFNSYVGEGFYFNNPHLIDGLFGFRKGWLLYAPIMVFSLIGVVLSFRKLSSFSWSLTVLFIFYTYVILSWWCWWYGGSWGLRAMIDFYPLLAVGMGLYIHWLFGLKRPMKVGGQLILMILIGFSLFQTLQYRWGIIHYDGMTKEAYIDALFRVEKSPDLEKLIKRPNYELARETGKE